MQGYWAKMNRSALRRLLRIVGVILVTSLPIVLALWFAQLRAVSETSSQLGSFSDLVLNKTEAVVHQADLAREAAEKYQGDICSEAHQENMLNIIRGRLYVDDLIYAQGQHFICSTVSKPSQPYMMAEPDYRRSPNISIYYYRDIPLYPGYRMTYLQRGHYAVAINPLSFSEVMTNDPALVYGVYDTVTGALFSASESADARHLRELAHQEASAFQQDGRFYTITRSAKRPIAVIVATTQARFYQNLWHQVALTLPLGILCSILLLLVWSRTRREFNSPRRRLQRALDRRQLRLHYQPIIDIKNNTCVGAEALLRWPGFNGQVMSPAEFIPLAENEGMIERITDYVVEEVFTDLGSYLSAHPGIYISINLSAADFHSPRLISLITDKAQEYSVRTQQIKIEVTERGFIDVPKTTPVIQAFRQAGYEVAIDDFGTGYSNLHNLYSLNVDILKIDKSFIDTLATNSTSHLIAEHIIEMAQSLRLKTIAEGVETAEQVNWLLKRGVQYCQGWHFAKAMPPQDFTGWLLQYAVLSTK
ncbi:sensor c-di-GMP phosphodiesterase-like protein [Enterobacter sp. BIGb0383]|nr:sensor c-di-GMP phosphodiesterase-like protein [Enterobacter sp. BIGb0383]ROS08326.1 sensor c-di-GMP phosphodiesterase-like protein [Enterobacter sp. BIGb0359]